MSIRKLCALLALGTLLAACGGGEAPKPEPAAPAKTEAAPAAAAATGTASIAGKISFEGTPPPPEKVRITTEPKCRAMHPGGLERRTIEVKDGGVAHAFVYVKSGLGGGYPTPTEPVLLDQKGCMYQPSVLAVRAGQPITIRNSDDLAHNIHPMPKINEPFNVSQPRPGEMTRKFDKPEVMIPVSCDVHPWMRSYISVFGHPFHAITKDDGTYEIKGLPAGEYEVEAVHPRLKSVTGKVAVKEGEAARLDLMYKG